MKRAVALALGLLVLVASWWAITSALTATGSWWLTAYLVLCVTLPMLRAVPRLVGGRPGFKALMRSLMPTSAGLLILTLVYRELTHDWMWASIAGAIIPGLVVSVSGWQTTKARVEAKQAAALLQAGRARDALVLAQSARAVFVAHGDRDAQASADLMLGLAYAKLGEGTRAARYLNSAVARLRSAGDKQQVGLAELALGQLRGQGVDTGSSAVSEDDTAGVAPRVDWKLLVSGALSFAFLGAAIRLWEFPDVRATWLALGYAGLVAFLLLYLNYAVLALVADRSGGRRNAVSPLIVANLGVLAFAASVLGLALGQQIVQVRDFPAAAQAGLSTFSTVVGGLPVVGLLAIAVIAALALLAALFLASGHSPSGLLAGVGRGDVTLQALELANGNIDTGEWGPAIRQLSRIDVTAVRNPEIQKQVLLCLGLAHCHEGHPSEARDYARELLELDGGNREGLYLSGYLNLSEGNLDSAEQSWRALCSIEPDYPSGGRRGTAPSARRYLCITLYRQAMAVMDADLDAGCRLLSEVSQLGALDREVADALTRVHLFRCTQAIRERDWPLAAQQSDLAQQKLGQLGALVSDPDELRKLKASCQAAAGLAAMADERYAPAVDLFKKANEEIEPLVRQVELAVGGSFLEQMLKLMMQQESGTETVSPNFGRDLHFFAGLAGLRALGEQVSRSRPRDWKSMVAVVETEFEASVAAAPTFVEGRALLGLMYYYFGADSATRDKGIEVLESTVGRVGSKLVKKTLEEHQAAKSRHADARSAYFDLLQRFLQFADVPRREREELRAQVIERMKATGQFEEFVGRGGLEISREEPPTVQEYLRRTELLRTKMDQLVAGGAAGDGSPELHRLIEELGSQNEGLQSTVDTIRTLERRILQAAQEYV